MHIKTLPASLKGLNIYLVGIKGTGMAALAELLIRRGAVVRGSDIDEKFYTDAILQNLGIPYFESFSADHIDESIDLIIHSAAYNMDNPELAAADNAQIPMMIYTEALGYLSTLSESLGIAGVHGKTTTTALAGTIAGSVQLEASVLVGSAVPTFDNFSTAHFGEKYFIAETCEYKRHFLDFHPRSIVLTSIEPDHLDYFKDYNDIMDAYLSYIDRLPNGGELIYCADDPGASEAAQIMRQKREDIHFIPYGLTADGPYKIHSVKRGDGLSTFSVELFDREFHLRIPGQHLILDAVGAMALNVETLRREGRTVDEMLAEKIASALYDFAGTRRRSEILGEEKGVLFMDDYAHHPTAIETTLKGLREFYPERRIIVDFMSHTYSRTSALLNDFARSFSAAHMVLLEPIYASAREKYEGSISGRDLFDKTAENHENVRYFNNFEETKEFLRETLQEGDLFITMGAGNNWQIGKSLYNEFKKEKESL